MYSVALQISMSPAQQYSTYGYHECLLTSREGVIVCIGRSVCVSGNGGLGVLVVLEIAT